MSKLTRLPMVNRGLLYWDGDGWRDDIGRRWLIDPRAAVLEELRAFMHRAWRRRMTTDRINREWYTVAEIADRFGVERSVARRRLAKLARLGVVESRKRYQTRASCREWRWHPGSPFSDGIPVGMRRQHQKRRSTP